MTAKKNGASKNYDIIIKNGLLFDGSGQKPNLRHIGIKDGLISAISNEPLKATKGTKVHDAQGQWVAPGFIDFHTHYDAEIEKLPELSESLRHGVTTISLGSCSLSLASGTPEDLADMFSRVEAVPREYVLPLLQKVKNWEGPAEYARHLDSLPLGPNVTSFLGHSAIRAKVMGLERSLTTGERPTQAEMEQMNDLLKEALDHGYLGLSVNTLTWDKMDGDRFRSKPLPSTFATWKEYRHFCKTLRERGRIFQGVPNVSTKYNVALFFAVSTGILRKKLKTTIISLMDPRSNRGLYRLVGGLAKMVNRVFRADFRFQSLPEIFDLYADGIDVVVFEEFGAGTAAIHLADLQERSQLLKTSKYRRWFKRQWTNKFLPRVFHRDFNQSKIVDCPDKSLIGKSFVQIAREQGRHVVDTYLDLCAEYGNDIRWYTVVANDRPKPLRYIVNHPDILIGFSDAGAHLRNMAHYNFPLRMLKLIQDSHREGRPIMPIEKAIWRLTGEIADWFEMDAGHITIGARADVVVVDPSGLDDSVEAFEEAPMPDFGGLVRMVRRNDQAVPLVIVNGRIAAQNGQLKREVGGDTGFGRFLPAGQESRERRVAKKIKLRKTPHSAAKKKIYQNPGQGKGRGRNQKKIVTVGPG